MITTIVQPWHEPPSSVRQKLASIEMREHHLLWHIVRNGADWHSLTQARRDELTTAGWTPPRSEGHSGSGIDFLKMHRDMIETVSGLSQRDGHAWRPIGWVDIPWDDDDPVWPMPTVTPSRTRVGRILSNAKAQTTTETYRRKVAKMFGDRRWLASQSLDSLGVSLELEIHGWMHFRWATDPPPDASALDPSNDWLGSPFSSHVNTHFWKLHGWIDDRIRAWEDARGEQADLSSGWTGPRPHLPHHGGARLTHRVILDRTEPFTIAWRPPGVDEA